MTTQQTLTLFPLSSYTFTTKAAQPEEDPSVAARLQRLQNQYEDLGIRHTAEGVLVVHDHGHPHVLMIQIANAFFKLPGNYLRPAEEETSGLARRLDEQLAPDEDDPVSFGPGGMSAGAGGDWEIGDCLAQWWRPSFETFMVSSSQSQEELNAYVSVRFSTLMFLLTSPKRKNARSFFSYRCLLLVRDTSQNQESLSLLFTFPQKFWLYQRT
jgi:hypothetical protein